MGNSIRRRDITILRRAYEQHGYIRVKMDRRRKQVRSGWEIRLLAHDPAEALTLTKSLQRLGFVPGKIHEKRGWQLIPLYGKAQVEQFLRQINPRRKDHVPAFPARVDMRRERASKTA